MATCTWKVSTADTGATPNTSGAFTPTLNDLVVAFVIATDTVDATLTISNSAGLTFTKVAGATPMRSSADRVYCYVADALAAASSQTITVDMPADAATGTVISVYCVSGMTRTGASALKQQKAAGNQTVVGDGDPEVILDAAALTGNPILCACTNATNPAAITPPSGWTETAGADVGYNSPVTGMEVCHRDSGFTGTTITWGAASPSNYACMAVELDTSSASVTVAPGVGAATITGTVSVMDKAIIPPVGEMTVTGLAPALFKDVPRFPGLGAMTISGLAPTMNKGIEPPVGSLTITGTVSVINRLASTPVGTLAVTGLAPALVQTLNSQLFPGVGSISVTGYASTLNTAIVPPVGSLSVTGLAPVSTVVVSIGVGTIAVTGLAPSSVLGPVINLGVGSAAITGYAATLAFNLPVPVGAIAFSGLAPSMQKGIGPGLGSLTLAGLAPALSVTSMIAVPVGSATFAGYAPSLQLGIFGGGGYGGLLVVLGLNFEPSNFTFIPAAADLQFTTWVPTFGAGFTYSVPKGTVTVAGYAPSLNISSGNQAPVMQAPPALVITGLIPAIAVGKHVTFSFDTDEQGFVGTPGALTVMSFSAGTGHGPGSLSTRLQSNNINSVNVWTLSTDWASLGVPANQNITGISLASAESRCLAFTNGFLSDVAAVTLTPTGFPSIQIAAGRSFSGVETEWTESAGAGASGRLIPSGGSLTITLGSTLHTPISGTTDVRLMQDNIAFVISYEAAVTGQPGVGSATITGRVPTVLSTAAEIVQPPAGALAVQGAGPSVSVGVPVTGGGGGPGLLMGIALNLEPRALGNATLVITGYAPVVFRPISLSGSDDLLSLRATAVGTGILIHAGSATKTPAAGTLTLAGLAPTLSQTGSRLFTMPVTALTITRFVPTLGIDRLVEPGVGSISITGLGPSMEPNYTVSPGLTALQIVGLAPTAFASITIDVGAGSLSISGLQPNPQRDVTSSPFAGVITTAGYAPFVSATDARRVDPPIAALAITGLAPIIGVSHLRSPPIASLTINGLGPTVTSSTFTAFVESPADGVIVVQGYAPLALVSVQIATPVGAITAQGYAPSIATTVPVAIGAGSIVIEGYAPTIKFATWNASGALTSQRATATGNGLVKHHATGVLQSQQPLAFSGTGKRGSVATGALQSGPASLHGEILSVNAALQSGRATLKARARIIRYKSHKRPHPHRVNRFNVVLKPNKRARFRKPKPRRPFK